MSGGMEQPSFKDRESFRAVGKVISRYMPMPQRRLTWRQRFYYLFWQRLPRLRAFWRRDPGLAPWGAGLAHACQRGSTLLIQDDMMERADRRKAMASIRDALAGVDCMPVLATSHADFAFYSRFGWLVEYLPRWSPEDVYYERKREYLAWRYRDAATIQLSAGMKLEAELLEDLKKAGILHANARQN